MKAGLWNLLEENEYQLWGWLRDVYIISAVLSRTEPGTQAAGNGLNVFISLIYFCMPACHSTHTWGSEELFQSQLLFSAPTGALDCRCRYASLHLSVHTRTQGQIPSTHGKNRCGSGNLRSQHGVRRAGKIPGACWPQSSQICEL